MEDIKKNFKLVFNPGCARRLLRAGCTIADIKQSKENPDKTIFCLLYTSPSPRD